MTKFLAAAISVVTAPIFFIAPAIAQFADQGTGPFTASGSTNAYVITVPNATTYNDLLGVLIKLIPNAANTGSIGPLSGSFK